MIYVDPPYNTGNDFVYRDNFAESAESFAAKTGAVDAEGARLVANPKSNGRFHSNWLDMIFPRLLLARELLRDDGVIFVSIDDNEVHNLRHVMDEVFGPENFVVQIIWKKRSTPPNDQVIGANHEYVIVYAKTGSELSMRLRTRTEKQIERYQNPDSHPKGDWTPGDLMANVKGGRYVASLHFPIRNPNTGEDHYPGPDGNWRFNRKRIDELLANNEIYFGVDGKGRPKLKRFLSEVKEGITWPTIWDFVPLNTQGSMEMESTFGTITAFDNPKPSGLISELIKVGAQPDAVILDFFAGSGTTGEAVMRLNQEDGGRRQFILVQLPEPTDNPAFPTIADITAERLRRVSVRLKAESASAQLALTDAAPPDLGFKLLHVAESFFRTWPDLAADADESAYQRTLDDALDDPLRPGWSPAGVLTEIALQEGFPLDASFAPAPAFTHNAVMHVAHPSLTQSLYVCLDPRLFAATVDAARALGPHDVFFCFDAALSDELKLRLADACRVKTI